MGLIEVARLVNGIQDHHAPRQQVGGVPRALDLPMRAVGETRCAKESALGGALAVVQNGDEIQLDVAGRQVELLVPAQEIQRRLQNFTLAPPKFDRGYGRMFLEHVTQANLGCDFDFLRKV